jgi:hypothetical protein
MIHRVAAAHSILYGAVIVIDKQPERLSLHLRHTAKFK